MSETYDQFQKDMDFEYKIHLVLDVTNFKDRITKQNCDVDLLRCTNGQQFLVQFSNLFCES